MARKKAKDADGGVAAAPVVVSIAAHPRARAGIRRARTRAALLVFALVLGLNLLGDQDPFEATWRALAAGIVANLVVWRCAIVVWRQLVVAEVKQAEQEREAELRERLDAHERAATESDSSLHFTSR